MKKIFTALAIAALSVPMAWSQTTDTPETPEVTGVPDDFRRPGDADLQSAFKFKDGVGAVEFTITAPTTYVNNDYDDVDLTEDQLLDKVQLFRSGNGDYNLELKTWENVKPGATMTFTDSDFETYGVMYNYTVSVTQWGQTNSYASKYVTVGLEPKVPERIVATNNGLTPVSIDVTIKDNLDIDGNELPVPITKLTVKRAPNGWGVQWVQIAEVESPEIGKAYHFEDSEAESGTKYKYAADVHTDFGSSTDSGYTIYVGVDRPGTPGDPVATINENGGVDITWTAPKNGENDGYFDPTSTLYYVERCANSERKTIAKDLIDTKFTDDLADIENEMYVYYQVTAYNDLGEGGYTSTYPSIIVGPAAKLPFHEGFNEGYGYYRYEEKLWENYRSDGSYGDGEIKTVDWGFDVHGVNWVKEDPDAGINEVEDGFVLTSMSSYSLSKIDYRRSGKISLEGADWPVISIYYVPMAHDMKLRVEGVDMEKPEETITFGVIDIKDGAPASDEGPWPWKKVSFPVGGHDIKGDMKILIGVQNVDDDETQLRGNVYYDEIDLDDYPGISGEIVASHDDDAMVTIGWNKPAGSKAVTHYDIFVDGEKEGTVKVEAAAGDAAKENAATDHTFSFQGTGGTTVKIGVQPVYGDIPSRLNEVELEVANTGSGIGSIITDTESEEYFTLQGVKIDRPAKGDVVVKRSVLRNGKVKVEKVVAE